MGKTILYLDQNFIAKMTEARLGVIDDVQEPGLWTSLFERSRELVRAGKIICPYSTLHTLEAMSAVQSWPERHITIGELWGGLRFRDWEDILELQVRWAYERWLGVPTKESQVKHWSVAFERNPHAQIPQRYLTDTIVPTDALFISPTSEHPWRAKKAEFVSDIEQRLAARKQRGIGIRDFEEEQQLEATDLIQTFIRNRWWPTRSPNEIGIGSDFWESNQIMRIPWVNVFSSIWAGILVHEPHRAPKPGDMSDVGILATVMPYCDIVTTDKNMKAILVRLGLDENYDVEVFGEVA